MSTAYNAYSPDYAVHPGEYLEEVLESRRISKKEFADRCGLSPKTVSQIVNGKASFSPDVALQFETVLGVAAEIWLGILFSWQLFQSRKKDEKRLHDAREWASQFPLTDMRRLGLVKRTMDWAGTIRQLLAFFNVSSPESWEDFYREKAIAYRKSPTLAASRYSVATWLRIGEKVAAGHEAQPYSKDRLRTAIDRIRTFTNVIPEVFEPKLRAECLAAGIVIVFVPDLQKTRISGATEWLGSDRALIAMSIRHKTNDHFWFTLFHEIGHLFLNEKKSVFIDVDSDDETDREIEANDFAREILVPTVEYKKFIARGRFFAADITDFAERVKIAPGIVVGLLQHDGLIKYSWHNGLKQMYELVRTTKSED